MAAPAPRSESSATDAVEDPRVLELVNEYQSEWERGFAPDRDRYQEIMPELAAYLDGLDLLYREMKNLTRLDGRPAPLGACLGRGAWIGEYQITRELGRGGMGVVYECYQASLKRRVALKILPAAFSADGNRLRRFAVEAQAAAALAHSHIVPVYAIGEDRGTHYYVMRLVEGFSLDMLIAKARELTELPGSNTAESERDNGIGATLYRLLKDRRSNRPAYYRIIAQIGQAVALALDHAHQNGVVHRDIKPANLLFGWDGHIWVTDFGLAQFTDVATVTQSGPAIGTLRYMSPEQASGNRRRLDHRTDIYSLAATLYELISGRPTFSAEEPATLLYQIIHDEAPRLRAVDSKAPADMETVLLKALAKDPQDRYATAAEFADDLGRFLADRPIVAHRPYAWERAKKWAVRHPAATTATGVLLFFLVAVSGVFVALTQRAYQAERDRADEAERRFNQSRKLGDLMIQISEEEAGLNVNTQSTRHRLLLAALESYRELLESSRSDPQMQTEFDGAKARIEALLIEEQVHRESWRVLLLLSPPVRAELGVSNGQIEQIGGVFAKHGVDPAVPTDLMGSLFDLHVRREVLQTLTAPQQNRLRELFVRVRGATAFSDPDVVDGLGLTPSQREQIHSIRLSKPYRPAILVLTPSGFLVAPVVRGGEVTTRFEDLLNSQEPDAKLTQILALLTPEQLEAWHTLIGKPFDIPVREP